jgi:hypothetical protein
MIVHRVELRVVPEACNGIAVEVAHGEAVGFGDCLGAGRVGEGSGIGRTHRKREHIHFATVERGLLGPVVVILVGGAGLRSVKTERVRGGDAVINREIRVVGQQRRGRGVV